MKNRGKLHSESTFYISFTFTLLFRQERLASCKKAVLSERVLLTYAVVARTSHC